MRILLDTNVLISALIKTGKPSELLDTVLAKNHALILSRPIIEEFSKVVADPRIKRYVEPEEAAAFLRMLVARGVVVRVTSRARTLKSADDVILNTAYDGQADLIVTGDKHLLELKQFKGIEIMSVSEALEEIQQRDGSNSKWILVVSPL